MRSKKRNHMPTKPNLISSVRLFCILAIALLTAAVTTPSNAKSSNPQNQDRHSKNAKSDEDTQEDQADEELAPAAVELDVSKASPLIRTLYQATRETKEPAILGKLAQAKKLLDEGADVKALDAQGRTALHWAVFGSSYTTKPKVVVAYEEIADSLLQKGVELNREDIYHDTALDYLLYSPTFEMQTLLIENGATSGFLAATFRLIEPPQEAKPDKRPAADQPARKIDLLPGLTLSVRLDAPVYSDRSRTGDPISATVTYPLCKDGEQVACKPGELMIAPGTKINGTILFAQKAPDKYSRPRLVLDFSNVVHANGQQTPLYSHVLTVDNARETVLNNEILGIVQPHATTKASIAMTALGAVNPIAGFTVKGVQSVYGLSLRREIQFPAGTDLQLQIVRPSMLKQKDSWPGWQQLPVDAELQQLANSAPMRTRTQTDVPSDPTNMMFLGSREQLVAAFAQAGWFEADNLGVKTALKAAQATVRKSGYANAPMSILLLEGRQPDVAFQKSLDTFERRHHLRIWKLEKKYHGQDVWIAAATHDIATDSSKGNTKWVHRIDPHIDRERNWVETDLLYIGAATAYADVDRPNAPRKIANATGDTIVTDGKIAVVQLANVKAPAGENSPPATSTQP
jgi:hypothetical protein